MNTIVRALPQQRFATRAQSKALVWKQKFYLALLITIVLFSAFTVVYVKDVYRRLFIDYQTLQNSQNEIYVEWGKLLLEQSTWSTQARVQSVAQQHLDMEAPEAKAVVMVQ